MASQTYQEREPVKVADLLQGIGHDVGRIAVDEIELARSKITGVLEKLVLQAAGAILGACVALIGLGMLCLAAVAALESVIPSLALRLVIMSFAFLAGGGGVAYAFARHLAASRVPKQIDETIHAVTKGLEH